MLNINFHKYRLIDTWLNRARESLRCQLRLAISPTFDFILLISKQSHHRYEKEENISFIYEFGARKCWITEQHNRLSEYGGILECTG